MKIEYVSKGIQFYTNYKDKIITFPLEALNKYYKKTLKSDDWSQLAVLEQLYFSSDLAEIGSGIYFLPNENIYKLEPVMKQLLGIPLAGIDIELSEIGNIGSEKYSIILDYIKNGIKLGRVERFGNIIVFGNTAYLLNEKQFELVKEIEHIELGLSMLDRSMNLAYIKSIAKAAGAKISRFTSSREFYYVADVSIDCNAINDQLIELKPEFQDIPCEVTEKLGDSLGTSEAIIVDGVRHNLFIAPNVIDKYNRLTSRKSITGSDVPKFLDNPTAFLPEEVEIDLDDFSRRVKGIKIHKSTAVPYIKVERNKNDHGWFDVSTGIKLVNDDDNSDVECSKMVEDHGESTSQELDINEFQNLMEEAKKNGDEYLYYKNQWIKINEEQGSMFLDKKHQFQEEFGDVTKISEDKIRKVLDIYENLEDVEYSEELKIRGDNTKDYLQRVSVPLSLQAVLMEHQIDGYSFLCNQYNNNRGTLLADDMGVGKTIQVIAFMLRLQELNKLSPALLVLPDILIQNWMKELKRFAPSIQNIYEHKGINRFKDPKIIKNFDVVLTTYETLARDQLILGKVKWHLLICDESQKIKNYKTLVASAVKGMNTECRIAMTGTPVENRLSELWSIVDFVQPGLLRSYQWFRKNYEEPIQTNENNSLELVKDLIDLINPIFIRRLKEDVMKSELPDKFEEKHIISLSNMQARLYLQELDSHNKYSGKMDVLKVIQRLIMICSHPRLIDNNLTGAIKTKELIAESKKLEETISILKEINRKREKVIIFTKYINMQLILKRVILDLFNVDAKIINGEAKGNRQMAVDNFNAKQGFDVLILSPKAAGVGLNVTGANHVIHYTREWNPAIENQATDRAYRKGQTLPVTVYYPISTYEGIYTVEEKLNDLLEAKRTLMREVIVPSGLEIKLDDFVECL